MRTRRAEPGDAEALAEIYLAARAQMTYLPEVDPLGVRVWIRDVVLPDLEVWVAEEGARIVGFAALGEDFLEDLYVHPEAQGRGIGGALLALSKERRPRGLQLWVFQKNRGARRFYERHGLALVRVTDGRENMEREPDALYQWPSTPSPNTAGA